MISLFRSNHDDPGALGIMRRILMGIFLMGLLGTGTELLLMDHTEEFWQYIPLVLMAISLVAVVWIGLGRRSYKGIRVFQGLMVLLVLSGPAGLILHFQSNAAFELEMYPSITRFDLFFEAITGTTPPTLAPGTMIFLGLIGLAYTYKHPVLSAALESQQKLQELYHVSKIPIGHHGLIFSCPVPFDLRLQSGRK